VAPKSQGEKRCKIKGGGQEMGVIIIQCQTFNNNNSSEFGAES